MVSFDWQRAFFKNSTIKYWQKHVSFFNWLKFKSSSFIDNREFRVKNLQKMCHLVLLFAYHAVAQRGNVFEYNNLWLLFCLTFVDICSLCCFLVNLMKSRKLVICEWLVLLFEYLLTTQILRISVLNNACFINRTFHRTFLWFSKFKLVIDWLMTLVRMIYNFLLLILRSVLILYSLCSHSILISLLCYLRLAARLVMPKIDENTIVTLIRSVLLCKVIRFTLIHSLRLHV